MAKKTYRLNKVSNKLPTMDKTIQLIGIVLLYLAGLSAFEDIIGKKCA